MHEDGFQPASHKPTYWHNADCSEEVKLLSTLVKFYRCTEKASLFVLIAWKVAALKKYNKVYIVNTGIRKLWKEQTPLRHAAIMPVGYKLGQNIMGRSCRGAGFSS